MIRKLIAHRHADSIRPSVAGNQINPRDLSFFPAVFSVGRYVERFSVGTQCVSRALVEPFGSDPDIAFGRTPSFHSPAEHFHAVGQILGSRCMHRLASTRAAEMS